jgi:hypothetical protein
METEEENEARETKKRKLKRKGLGEKEKWEGK